jgi:dihydrodipicolinate synthase/N-acetylneuraminate lyase
VGVDIAMALNPGLKTIFLHDGSLMDHEALKTIVKKIENNGFQAIIECVSESEDVEVRFTETELK